MEYYYGDQLKEEEMNEMCNTRWEDANDSQRRRFRSPRGIWEGTIKNDLKEIKYDDVE
jgi:hypothetical protein